MQYGDGWAYDSTQSHYKRAKPTYTDPEDDKMIDSSLPIGSTSKTYDPRKDGSFWQRKDGSQDWSHSSSSTGQWKPRLRHEKSFSSAAGDTSDASNAVHRLGSIHETDGDAVKAPSDRAHQCMCRLSVASKHGASERLSLRTSVLTRSERITDALFMTAEWTTVLTCQVNGCVSHDGSVDHSPYMPNLGTTNECKGPQSHPVWSVRS